MRKPTIDELLVQEGSIYTLTMLAAKRARQLKILDRETKLPLQQALDEIADGHVTAEFDNTEVSDLMLIDSIHGRADVPDSQHIEDDKTESEGRVVAREKQQTLFPQ